jgi:hypothetical protein
MEAMEQATIRIAPQAGPQMVACASSADILIYGGQAGGGKSWLLVAEPLRHVGRKGFNGAIFRRTFPQLKGQGGIWNEAWGIYPQFGARMREGQELDATFPSGANIAFCHLQHEKTKYEYMGHQICYLGFDELTHFSETQFFYMLSRNRSTCGIKPYVRATCNPDARSWVAGFIAWWIDQETGYAIPERSGVLRYFIRENEKIVWGDTKEELLQDRPDYGPDDILSVTFVPAKLDDNPALLQKDPSYRAKLRLQPKVERARLELGNWKETEGSQIDPSWVRRYSILDDMFEFVFQSHLHRIPQHAFQRIAVIDTAGTSKEKAAEKRGDNPSWSVCSVWDVLQSHAIAIGNQRVVLSNLLFLRYIWRDRVDWNQLKVGINDTLSTWSVSRAYCENAHYGKPLATEIKSCQVQLIGPKIPGMDDTSRGAKLERAIASGMLSAFELGRVFVPEDKANWLTTYLNELTTWTGLPDETADQIDVTSYACYVSKQQSGRWGGVINL